MDLFLISIRFKIDTIINTFDENAFSESFFIEDMCFAFSFADSRSKKLNFQKIQL